jgi:4-hydroxybenzoate polyprenyltransferase
MASYWSTGWIWLSLAIFIAIGVVMNRYGGRMIDRISDTRDDREMERLLSRFKPWVLAVVGGGGLLVILYLMLFKPF